MKIQVQYWERLNDNQIEELKLFANSVWLLDRDDVARDIMKQITESFRVYGNRENEIVYRVTN